MLTGLSACLSVCMSVCLSVRPFFRLSVCLSVCPSVRFSVCLSVCLSVRLSVCLSVCLSPYTHTHIVHTYTQTYKVWRRHSLHDCDSSDSDRVYSLMSVYPAYQILSLFLVVLTYNIVKYYIQMHIFQVDD